MTTVTLEPGLSLIIYTDGGCKPNPNGFGGVGTHGYFWRPKDSKAGAGHPTHIPTNEGYILKADYKDIAKNPKAAIVEVEPVAYIDYVSTDPNSTNNRTELMAFIQGLQIGLDHKVKHIELYVDSQYVLERFKRIDMIHGVNYEFRGEQAKNGDLLRRLYEVKEALVAAGITWQANKIAGHSNHPGNDGADLLASIGVAVLTNGKPRTDTVLTDAKGYWRKDIERHPFLQSQSIYFNSDPEAVQRGVYLLGSHADKTQFLGTRQTSGAYAVVQLDKPSEVLEAVRTTAYNRSDARGWQCLMFATLDRVFNARNHKLIDEYGEDVVVERPDDLNLYILKARTSELFIEAVDPPLLAWRAFDTLAVLDGIYEQAKAGHKSLTITDITDKFYETVETKKRGEVVKSKQLLSKYKVGFKSLPIKIPCTTVEGKVLDLPTNLILGVDLPNRNALKRIEADNPKIQLVSWAMSEDAFRYAVIIHTDDARGIWAGWYSNFLFVPKA